MNPVGDGGLLSAREALLALLLGKVEPVRDLFDNFGNLPRLRLRRASRTGRMRDW
jgi:hypothetical protein